MNAIDSSMHFRQGLIDGFVSRGVPEDRAEYFVKQAEIASFRDMNPAAFDEGYAEAMEKAAAGFAIVPLDGDADVGDSSTKDPIDVDYSGESFWDKLKRWGLLAGVGAGSFALGSYWPDFKDGVRNTVDRYLAKNDPGSGSDGSGGGSSGAGG